LGESGLKAKGVVLGNTPKLNKEQLEIFKTELLKGALAHGFEADNWSRERMKELIQNKFGVSFQVSHMSKLMR
jgi:transposase